MRQRRCKNRKKKEEKEKEEIPIVLFVQFFFCVCVWRVLRIVYLGEGSGFFIFLFARILFSKRDVVADIGVA